MISFTMPHRLRPRRVAAVLALTLVVAGATPAAAFTSGHASLDLVWGPGEDCISQPLTLAGDYLWSCDVAIPAPGRYYFQAWTGDQDDPKYGADPGVPDGVLLAADPSSIPWDFDAPGYRVFRLFEDTERFEFVAAPGSMRVTVVFADDPLTPPGDLALRVHEHDGGALVGGYVPTASPDVIEAPNLLPGRSYDLSVSASGYATHDETRALPDETTLEFTVTLQPLVPAETPSWGAVKNLFN